MISMTIGQQYSLWFINQSTAAGMACVYQDLANINSPTNVDTLAWMLAGVNSSVMVKFIWRTNYNFSWFDYANPRTQQIIDADLNDKNSVVLTQNFYGFYFSEPIKTDSRNTLTVNQDGTLASVTSAVTGIGMGGAGTFARSVAPNVKSVFSTVGDSSLVYRISFGYYDYDVNDRLDLSELNLSQRISFPAGVYEMTAVLNAQNVWKVYPGRPDSMSAVAATTHFLYQPGIGLLRSALHDLHE
jgi:rhizosphere induced protein